MKSNKIIRIYVSPKWGYLLKLLGIASHNKVDQYEINKTNKA